MKQYKQLPVRTRKIRKIDLRNKEKVVEKFYDSASKSYYGDHHGRFCDEILEYFIFHFLPKPPKEVLDLGGGVGRFALPLAKAGNEVVLVDMSAGMLRSAKSIAAQSDISLKCINASASDLRTLDRDFDAVICMNSVLDYCSDYKKVLSEVKTVLRRDGIFIGSVNNLFCYSTENDLKSGKIEIFKKSMKTGNRYIKWGAASHGHVTHEFTQKELLDALKTAGFRNIRILGVFNLLGKYFNDRTFLAKIDKDAFFKLQLEYAKKSEYINNSTDFFFVCKKG